MTLPTLHPLKPLSLLSVAAFALSSVALTPMNAQAQINMDQKPVLIISDETTSMPSSPVAMPSAPIYSTPSRAPETTAAQISGNAYFEPMETPVGRKIDQMRSDLFALQTRLNGISEAISGAHRNNQQLAAAYNADIATISTALQSGTTPGNPRLVQRLNQAQGNLNAISKNVTDVNGITVRAAELASMAAFLLEATRSTYALSGAIEEDHVRLAQLEDQINGVIVLIDRLQLETTDTLSRTNAFLATERNNLRTISMGVTAGDMFGTSLRRRGFETAIVPVAPVAAPAFVPTPSAAPMPTTMTPSVMQPASYTPPPAGSRIRTGMRSSASVGTGFMPMTPPSTSSGQPEQRRPLAKIKFDRPNVNYKQPVYMAVKDALDKYPSGTIEIVAVHPDSANTAQVAIESTRARRNAENVMRSLEEMGISSTRINMTTSQSREARSSEVHLFVR